MAPALLYVCADEVNRALVSTWLARHGGTLTAVAATAHACLVDLDHLPFGRDRDRVLQDVASVRGPAVVHSYNLDAATRRQLRKAGILTARRLTGRLVKWL